MQNIIVCIPWAWILDIMLIALVSKVTLLEWLSKWIFLGKIKSTIYCKIALFDSSLFKDLLYNCAKVLWALVQKFKSHSIRVTFKICAVLGAQGIRATGFRRAQGNQHCSKFESHTNRVTFETNAISITSSILALCDSNFQNT